MRFPSLVASLFVLLSGVAACSSGGNSGVPLAGDASVDTRRDGGADAGIDLESLFDEPALGAERFDVVEGLWRDIDTSLGARALLRDGWVTVAGKCNGGPAFGFTVRYATALAQGAVSSLTIESPGQAKHENCTLQIFESNVPAPLQNGRLVLPVSYGLDGEFKPYEPGRGTVTVIEMPSGKSETSEMTGTAIPALYKIGD